MIEHPNAIPIAVVVAIALFLVREVLEAFRRHAANERKLHAIRRFVSAECERNNFALKRLEEQLRAVQEALLDGSTVEIEFRKNGVARFKQSRAEGQFSSSPVPVIYTTNLEKYLFDAASLSASLFNVMEDAQVALVDVRHVRDSLVEYLTEERDALDGFPSWALREVDKALDPIRNLYFHCTTEPLAEWRVR